MASVRGDQVVGRVKFALSASYAPGSISSSYALTASYVEGGGGSTTPGGSNTQIQYNNSNTFGGVPTLVYDGALRGTGSFSGSFTGILTGTSSYAITASYALNSGGGSTSPGGSNTQIQFNGNGVFSGSSNFTFDSASKALTLTGSLNITGSTTQTGNNTLTGNTSLSGSITISGSLGQPNPTISIFGDLNQTGYTRYLPVATNLDTTISASYIFVSGSTQDLYFSQNGKGYNNITRLRWIEGNLYTGIFNGGLITTQSSTVYQVGSGSGIIVNLNASYNDNPYPTVQYINWNNLSASIATLSASYDQSFVAINSASAITVQGTPYNDGDFNTKIPIGIVIHQNRSTINAVQTFPGVAYGWKQRSYDFIRAFGPLKISGYTLSVSGSSTGSLLLSGGTSWVDGRNYIVDPNNPSYITEATGITTSKIYRYYQSGSDWKYDTNGGVGYATIDPSKYSNNGTLTSVGTNDWTIQRVFYFPNSATKALYIYYGNATYANEAAALAAVSTETFTEAPNTAANAIYVGFMLLRYNANFTNDASYTFYQASLFRAAGTGGGGGGGATSPGGSDTQIQYNNAGAFDGVTNLTWNGATLSATGSFTGSFTGSLQGTASYALNGGVTQLLAGSNITLSPTNGLGQVTITSTGGGGIYGNTATGSYGSFYSTQTQTAAAINTPYSMSFNTTDISNGVSISGSANSSIKLANAGIYDLEFSAQLNKVGSGGGVANVLIWLRKNNIDLAATNTYVQLQGGANSKVVAAWNWFLNAAAGDEYRIMWATDDTNAQIYYEAVPTNGPSVPSVIATVARIDQFLSNTGSFSGSFTGTLFGTSSWATNALTASFAPNYVLNSQTSSFVQNSQTSSFVLNSQTSSFVLNSVTASMTVLSSSFAISSSRAVSSSFTLTASFFSGTVTSASYALTASYFNGVFGNNYTASFTNQSTWTVNHNLGNRNVLVQAYDSNYQQIIPQTVTQTDTNTATIIFPTNESGFAVVSLGGSYNLSTASFSNQATSASFSNQAISASYALTSSVTTTALTASYVNTLNQNVLITGSLTVGSSSLGTSENTLTLGPAPAGGVGEGGQLGLLSVNSGSYTSASFLDTWQDTFRILRGPNNASNASVFNINLQTGDVNLPLGSITMPARPAFRVSGSSITGIAATTTITSTQGAAIDYNQGSYYNNTTGIFTAPIAGLYQVYFNCRTQTAGSQQVIIYRNAAAVMMWETNANTGHFGISSIVYLAVNDTLKATVTVGTVQFDGNDNWGAAFIG